MPQAVVVEAEEGMVNHRAAEVGEVILLWARMAQDSKDRVAGLHRLRAQEEVVVVRPLAGAVMAALLWPSRLVGSFMVLSVGLGPMQRYFTLPPRASRV